MTSIHIDPSKQPTKYREKIKITGGVWRGRSESDLGYPTHGIVPISVSSLPLHVSSIPHYLSVIPLRSSRFTRTTRAGEASFWPSDPPFMSSFFSASVLRDKFLEVQRGCRSREDFESQPMRVARTILFLLAILATTKI
ncbi:hypothetical protein SLEP1_g53176 [Rubroshorea leprosula]|uniref:Uncharacterized protein n=1 Tax=Rubroshorea leprosula TaxID=152421 RepID=A0AAV5M9M2_9ROSI|nr:hypothetical protein SLEP1_g53176 [Rubroshorea leprosula]